MEWPRSSVFRERRENGCRKAGGCAPCVKSRRTISNKFRMKRFGLAFLDHDFWASLCWFTNLEEVPKGCALLSAFLRTCCSTAALSYGQYVHESFFFLIEKQLTCVSEFVLHEIKRDKLFVNIFPGFCFLLATGCYKMTWSHPLKMP